MREQGTLVPIIPAIDRESCRFERRNDAAWFFNQQIEVLFSQSYDRLEARDELFKGSPWIPILDGEGEEMCDESGELAEERVQYFPLPFLETNHCGYIFNSYKSRFVRHSLNLLIKMACAARVFPPEFHPSLFRCPGTQA
jgi:hypothetical protein